MAKNHHHHNNSKTLHAAWEQTGSTREAEWGGCACVMTPLPVSPARISHSFILEAWRESEKKNGTLVSKSSEKAYAHLHGLRWTHEGRRKCLSPIVLTLGFLTHRIQQGTNAVLPAKWCWVHLGRAAHPFWGLPLMSSQFLCESSWGHPWDVKALKRGLHRTLIQFIWDYPSALAQTFTPQSVSHFYILPGRASKRAHWRLYKGLKWRHEVTLNIKCQQYKNALIWTIWDASHY